MESEEPVPDELEQFMAELRAERPAPPELTPEEAEQAKRELIELLDEMDEEFGKPSPEDTAWARRVLGL